MNPLPHRFAVFMIAALSAAFLFESASGDERKQTPAPADRVPEDAKPDRSGDVPETVLKFAPVKPQTEEDRKKIEATSHYMNGLIYQRRGDFQSASDEFRKALAADPDGIEIYRALIVLDLKANDVNAAQDLLIKALKRSPNDLQMLRLLERIYQQRGQIAQAIEILERCLDSPELVPGSQEHVVLAIEIGLLYRSQGETQKAADAYEMIFQAVQHPERFGLASGPAAALLKNPELSYERIGSVFLEAGRYDLALSAFEKAEEDPKIKPEEIAYFKAKIFYEQKKYERALELLQTYFNRKLQSRGVEPYTLLAQTLTKLGREKDIEGELERLSDADPGNNYILYAVADYYLQKNDLEQAERYYQKAIARGADPEGYQGLMGLYHRQKKPAAWLGALSGLLGLGQDVNGIEEEFKQVSEDAEFLTAVNEEARKLKDTDSKKFGFAEAYILGRLNAAAKRTPDVIDFYKMTIAFRPNQGPTRYLELAQYLNEQKAYAEIETIMEEALSSPANAAIRRQYSMILAQALLSLSFDLEQEGKAKVALVKATRANEVFPENPIVLFRLGWLQWRNKDPKSSIATFEGIISKYDRPGNEQADDIVRRSHFILSSIYVQEGDERKGEELLEKMYKQDPDDPSVNNDLGYLYADHNKNLEQAEKMIRKAVAAEPDNTAYQDSLGWVLYRLGKLDEALKYLLMAVKDSTEGDATIWDHLGDVYEKQGRRQKAVDAWKEGLRQAKEDKFRDEKVIDALQRKLQIAPGENPLVAPRPGEKS